MVNLKEFNSFVKRYDLFQQSPTIYDAISGTSKFEVRPSKERSDTARTRIKGTILSKSSKKI